MLAQNIFDRRRRSYWVRDSDQKMSARLLRL